MLFHIYLVCFQKCLICNLVGTKILELKSVFVFFISYTKRQSIFFYQSDDKQTFCI